MIAANNVTLRVGKKALFEDVNIKFTEGNCYGMIGANGAGKSTFLKILSGQLEPTNGDVTITPGQRLSFLEQDHFKYDSYPVLDTVIMGNARLYEIMKEKEALYAKEDFTDEDGIKASELEGEFAEMNGWEAETDAEQLLNGLGIEPELHYAQMADLTGSQKVKVLLARALFGYPDILLLDEPTNHLDLGAIEWLEEYLIQFRGAILMVTHDRYFLDRVVNRIVEVDHGKLYNYPGNYSEFVRLKAERQNMELATERKRKSLLRTELEWLHRGARARSTKQKAHIARIHAMQEMKDIQEEKRVMLDSVASRMGNKTIELSGICKSYGEKKLIEDFSYIFLKKDRIGIIGHNGCGKSTLLKIINGIIKPDVGTIEIGQTIKIGYFSQENEYMDESERVIDYVKEAGEYIATSDGKITASQMLERFLFDGAMQWSRIEKLSGGEKRRLYLLRVLMEAPNVLILDEPTNDLDIQTLTILEDYLDHFDGIILIVSHDRYFLDRTVSRIFAFNGGGKIRQSEGGYSDYLIRVELEKPKDGQTIAENMSDAASAQTGESDSKKTWKQREKKLKFSYKEQREYETIDEDIAKLEEKIEKLDREMVKNATNSVKLSELMKEKEETETTLEEKMDRWVYLNDLAEQIENQ